MKRTTLNITLIASIFLILAVVAIAGCTGTATNNPSGTPSGTSSSSSSSNFHTLNVATTPGAGKDVMYAPLIAYLHNATGYDINFQVASTDAGVSTAMQSGKVDLAFAGGLPYVMANETFGAQIIAMALDTHGNNTYNSLIIGTPEVAQTLGITTPLVGQSGMDTLKADLDKNQGKFTYTFVSPGSTSGYGIPRVAMYQSHLDPTYEFKAVGFSGGDAASILSVSQKTVDLSTCSGVTWNLDVVNSSMTSVVNNVKVIWISDPIPQSTAYIRSDLPQDVKDKITQAILNAPASVYIPTGYGGYIRTTDSNYTIIHNLNKVLQQLTS